MDPINPMAFWQDQNTLYSPSDTTEGDKKLNEWLKSGSTADYSAPARLAYGALTTLPRAAEGLANTAGNIGRWIGAIDSPPFQPSLPSLPAGQTTAQSAADLASGLAPAFLQMAATGGLIGGATRLSGLASVAPRIARTVAGGLEFGSLAASTGDATTTAEQVAEGGLSGLITSSLAKGDWRRIAGSMLLGGFSKMFFDRDGGHKVIGDITQGDIAGTVLTGVTMLAGKPIPKWTAPIVGEIPTKVQPPSTPTDYSLRNKIDAKVGVQNPGMRTAADSAAAMQAAWGFDPSVTGSDPITSLPKSAQLSGKEMQYAGLITPEPREPIPGTEAIQFTTRPEMLARQQGIQSFMPSQGPEVPLLPEGNLGQYTNRNIQPPIDLSAPQSQQELLNRTPGNVYPSPWGFRERPVTIPLDGPIRPPEAQPKSADYLTQSVFNPANNQAVQQAAFGGLNPDLLHQGQMTLQQLQTQWFAEDVLQANRQQTHNFVDWMHGVADRPDNVIGTPDTLPSSSIAKLAASPTIPVEDLASELRNYSEPERQAIGQAMSVDPNDTTALARALKDKFDPSLRPRTPPQTTVTDAQMQAMLHGEESSSQPQNPLAYSSEGEATTTGSQKGMARAYDPNTPNIGGYADPRMLYAGVRGIAGTTAGLIATKDDQNMSEGEKWLLAATLGGAAMFGPAIVRTLGHAGEAEAKIPTWGGKQVPRIGPAVEPPPPHGINPRLAEMEANAQATAVAKENEATLQRLQSESTTKGKVSDTPSWLRNEGGFSTPEMSAALMRATTGGLIGGVAGGMVDDPGSHTSMVAGAIGGALLSFAGPEIIRRVLAEHAQSKSPDISSTPETAKVLNTTAQVRKYSFPELIAKAQLAINQKTVLGKSASLTDFALSRLDNWFGLSKGDIFKRVLSQSYGPAAYLTQGIDEAFRKLSFIKVDPAMRELTNRFLDGELPKEEYVKQMSIDSNSKAYADFAIVARDNADGLINLASKGQGNNVRTEMMQDSMGKYLTRSHRLFVDPAYSPSVEATNKLAQKIFESGAWADAENGKVPSLDQITSGLNQYVKDIQQSKGVYRPESGKKIDQTVFNQRKPLDVEWKQFLGEITDPVDRIRLTVLKLKPMAEASNFMHMVTNGLTKSDEGLRFVFNDRGALEAEQQKTLQSLQKDPTNPELRKQLLELQQYQYVAPDARYGALQGQYVHRNVYDVMNDWDQSMKTNSAAGRALMGINQIMKANVTYRNPMATIRQVLTAPFFLQISRGFGEMEQAWDVIRNSDHPLNKELMENGISNVDSITKDVLRDVDHLSNGMMAVNGSDGAMAFLGRIDQNIGKAVSVGKFVDSKLADYFKMPDNFVRIATYLSAKTRFAKELGASLDSPEVINKAVEHTNRYTMNYAHLPQAVVKGRNVPFVNMFISYAAEMGRILKNVGEDVISGDGASRMNAVMALGTLVAIPEMLQRSSEASLSPSDKKDWDKVKAGLPTYMKDRYMIVSRDKTTGNFRIHDFSNLLPADQFQQTIRALSEGRVLDAAANNPFGGWDKNPALNIASTWITGRDRFTDRTLRGPGDYGANALKEIGGPFVPGGSQSEAFHKAFDINVNGTRGITDKKGRTLSAEDFWLPYATGIKAGNINPKIIEQSAISEYKSGVANEMAYFNDIRKSNQSAEVVEKAAGRTKQALQQLQMQLNYKLGIPPTP